MQKITLTILLSLLFCLFADFLKASDTITVQLTTSSPNPANTPQFEILIQFSDSVDDLDIADIVVENGYLADLRIGNNYRLQWTAKIWAFNEGWIKIYMPANATYRFPDYQVGNTASDTLILYFDNSKPRPILSSLAQTPTKNPEFDVSVQFTEYVVNFDPNDIVYTNSEIISIEEIEPGRSYKYIFRALVDGFAEVHMPSQICTDQAGNVNYSSNTISVKFDTRPPGAVLTAYPDTLVNLLNYTFRVTFDESVTGLDSADFVMHNATFKSLVVVKDKEIWDVTITHLADGHAWVYLKDNTVIDLLENSNTGTDTIFWRYDGTPPTTQLTTYHKQITNSDTVWFYVAFSEPVYYFTTRGSF